MIPLQWIDSQFVDQKAMFNNGEYKDDKAPVCKFEASAFKVEAPGKSLNATDDLVDNTKRTKITQRNCQTWIIESAEQLAKDGIFTENVVDYLKAIRQ
ncbi:hypothetical protein MGN70_001860 [Eutypa lata]|nr:hypothetical protein MGN70_001860 [Eutypa lata]